MIYIENIKVYGGPGIKIMRGTPLGNPFVIGRDGDRDEVIEKYRGWLWKQIKCRTGQPYIMLNKIKAQAIAGDVHLICCCKPLRCHGDIVKAAVEWMIKAGA
jgi:hypothetical protein